MGSIVPVLLSLAPLLVTALAFLLALFIMARGSTAERVKAIVSVFLVTPVTLKTWALVIAGPMLCLMLNGIIAKIADNASWPNVDAVSRLRIETLRELAWGLEILLSIVLGALGAVTFKGQGPGGTSFQLSQDATGTTTASATAPVAAPAPAPKEQ